MKQYLIPTQKPKSSIGDDITQEHRDAVIKWIAEGHTHKGVIVLLRGKGIDIKHTTTFENHFRAEIDEGRAILETFLQNTAYKKAMSDDPKNNNILMFVLKTKFRWQETARFEIDPNAEPIEQLKSLLQQASNGGLTIDAAVKAASLIETTEKASKGNLGEVMPSVIVTQYGADDFANEKQEIDKHDIDTGNS